MMPMYQAVLQKAILWQAIVSILKNRHPGRQRRTKGRKFRAIAEPREI
jgi:hypothetical protein